MQKEALRQVRQDLALRKQGSVKNMGLAFKRADWNGNKRLDRQEFDDALRSVGVFLKSQQLSAVFRAFDKDDSGAVSSNLGNRIAAVPEPCRASVLKAAPPGGCGFCQVSRATCAASTFMAVYQD